MIRRCVGLVLIGWLVLGCSGGTETSTSASVEGAAAQTFKWRMITTWPKNLPGLGTGPERIADRVRQMSSGRLDIKVYGAGELVGAFEVFDAVSQGTAQMGHGASYYWRGKLPVAAMFATVPFGMTAQEMNAWLHFGGGMELWREAYAPFNLVPFAAGNSGQQMAGWFNKEINTLEDLKGLRMRIPGLGGEVLQRAGGAPVALPGGEVFTSLQTGVIDATEWVGPYNDLTLGLHTVAKYYYYPGWHEPGPTLEAIVNSQAWESLPADLQMMVEAATRMVNDEMLAEFTARNASSLQTLLNDHNVELRRLPDQVLARLKELSAEVVAETAQDNDLAKRIHASYTAFLAQQQTYQAVAEKAYLEAR